MGCTLVIDTSFGSTVGIVGREPIVETDSRTHVEKLQVNIARAVEEAGLTPADIEEIVVGIGPAPFTGLRAGIVAAKAPGTATITVKSSVWTDVEAQCQVTVTDEVGADVPMSEFLLNTSSVTMLAGTTYTNVRLYGYAPFYATDLNLEWTSSDESVVTVDAQRTGDELTQYAKLTAHEARHGHRYRQGQERHRLL